ncbi:dnaJ homolog subfamily C member 30, mitochondrial-like [Liolophura sinensis]|uniref:dnaJ homolog subfamily C member 30, mitochondrial-like n=1 Tax=Liolophura sinensis TaxID=3198878 RepID=UPI003158EBF4
MYHPDVNKSREASTRFAAISEAYETLGNVQKRKLYDRGFFNPSGTQGHYKDDSSGPAPFRDVHGFRERTKTPPRGKTNIYNFDEFYRRHYEESMQQKEHDKEMFRRANIEKVSAEGDKARGFLILGISIGFILALWPFASSERRSKGDR